MVHTVMVFIGYIDRKLQRDRQLDLIYRYRSIDKVQLGVKQYQNRFHTSVNVEY